MWYDWIVLLSGLLPDAGTVCIAADVEVFINLFASFVFGVFLSRARSSTRQRVTCCSLSIIRPYCTTANCPPVSPSRTTLGPQMLSSASSPPPRTTPPFSSIPHMRSCCRWDAFDVTLCLYRRVVAVPTGVYCWNCHYLTLSWSRNATPTLKQCQYRFIQRSHVSTLLPSCCAACTTL